METKTTTGQPGAPAAKRPMWLRIVIWIGGAFLLFNIFGVALFFIPSPSIDIGQVVQLALAAATVAVPLWKWNGLNVLRTWRNAATASFTRRDDPATGGVLFDVQPARAARMPALPLFIIGVFLLLIALVTGTQSTGGFIWPYVVAAVFIGVGCSYVTPGARDRKPVSISVAAHGVQSGDIGMPLKAVAELQMAHGGIVIAPDSLAPGPNGVPISSMAGRYMGKRQSARGYVVTIRADGESAFSVLAGGLTEDCARTLIADLGKAIEMEGKKLSG